MAEGVDTESLEEQVFGEYACFSVDDVRRLAEADDGADI